MKMSREKAIDEYAYKMQHILNEAEQGLKASRGFTRESGEMRRQTLRRIQILLDDANEAERASR